MPEYTVTIETDPGVAGDASFFEQLIDVVYADSRFVSPALALGEDTSSVTFIFNLEAMSWPAATERAANLVAEALARVQSGQRRDRIVGTAVFLAALALVAKVVLEREKVAA
jgi:hypothetical protein